MISKWQNIPYDRFGSLAPLISMGRKLFSFCCQWPQFCRRHRLLMYTYSIKSKGNDWVGILWPAFDIDASLSLSVCLHLLLSVLLFSILVLFRRSFSYIEPLREQHVYIHYTGSGWGGRCAFLFSFSHFNGQSIDLGDELKLSLSIHFMIFEHWIAQYRLKYIRMRCAHKYSSKSSSSWMISKSNK